MVIMLHRLPLGSTSAAPAPAWDTPAAPPPPVGSGAGVPGVRDGGPLEIKELGWAFEGLASPFYEVDHAGDEVQPGAFLESLASNPRPPLLWSHDPSKVVGVPVRLKETPEGLWGEWRLSKTALGRDVRQLLLDQALNGLSIGYRIHPADAEHVRGVRKLKRISLYEISLVAMPAAHGARISRVKSLPEAPVSYLAAFLERQRRREEDDYQRVWAKSLHLKLRLAQAEAEQRERGRRAWAGY